MTRLINFILYKLYKLGYIKYKVLTNGLKYKALNERYTDKVYYDTNTGIKYEKI